MERYLLFDSGCSLCTRMAKEIEREADGLLKARSLREPEVKAMLDKVSPGWRWEPMLLEVDDDNIKAFSGLGMRARLISSIGLRRAWRVANLISEKSLPSWQTKSNRRKFLKGAGAVLAGLGAWSLLPKSGKAQDGNNVFLPIVGNTQSAPSYTANGYKYILVEGNDRKEQYLTSFEGQELYSAVNDTLVANTDSPTSELSVYEVFDVDTDEFLGFGLGHLIAMSTGEYGSVMGMSFQGETMVQGLALSVSEDKQELVGRTFQPVAESVEAADDSSAIQIIESQRSVSLEDIAAEYGEVSAAGTTQIPNPLKCSGFCQLMCAVGWGVACLIACPVTGPGAPFCAAACGVGAAIYCGNCPAFCRANGFD